MISGRAILAGVIGWPVSHSRSPLLHNAWLARHGIDGAYVPLAVAPERFAEAVSGLRAAGFAGANVTIPHKERAFSVCTIIDESARGAGAVNTLVFGANGVRGSNTDGAGFIANLRAHGVDPTVGRVLVLGAGGAARAIASALMQLGVSVFISNRSAERAEFLAHALPGLTVVNWNKRNAAIGACALLINASAAGMAGGAALDIDLAAADPALVVADIVYVPQRTALLADAAARGLRCVGGLGMLLHQAVPGFAAWFGVTPVVDAEIVALVSADIPHA